jgi:flagellar biosynthesis protein
MPDPFPHPNPDGEQRPARPGDEGRLQAAALRYDPGKENAPRMVARGAGLSAEKILELARTNDVPVHKDPTLISILGALDIGAEVPPDLYGVIAEVLAWAYRTDRVAALRHAA